MSESRDVIFDGSSRSLSPASGRPSRVAAGAHRVLLRDSLGHRRQRSGHARGRRAEWLEEETDRSTPTTTPFMNASCRADQSRGSCCTSRASPDGGFASSRSGRHASSTTVSSRRRLMPIIREIAASDAREPERSRSTSCTGSSSRPTPPRCALLRAPALGATKRESPCCLRLKGAATRPSRGHALRIVPVQRRHRPRVALGVTPDRPARAVRGCREREDRRRHRRSRARGPRSSAG
jgi:hypothetical protein